MGVTTTPILHIIDTEANLKGASGLGAGQIGFASDTKRFIANVGGVFWAFAPEYVGLTLQDINGATINAVAEFQGDGGSLTGLVGENITCDTGITGLTASNLSLGLAELKGLINALTSGGYLPLSAGVGSPLTGILYGTSVSLTGDISGNNSAARYSLGNNSIVDAGDTQGSATVLLENGQGQSLLAYSKRQADGGKVGIRFVCTSNASGAELRVVNGTDEAVFYLPPADSADATLFTTAGGTLTGQFNGTTATFTTGPVYVQYDDSTAYSATVAAVRPTHTVGAYSINTKAQDGTAAYSIVRATSSGGSVNACSFGITSASAYADSFAWWGFNDSATTWKERMRLTNAGLLTVQGLAVNGAPKRRYTSRTATASTAATDNVVVFSGSTASQIETMPDAAALVDNCGRVITYKNLATVAWTIRQASSNTLDGSAADFSLPVGASLTVMETGDNTWVVI